MIDPFVMVAPFLLLLIIGLLQFVGCNAIFGLHDVTEAVPKVISSQQDPASTVETANSDSVSAQFGFPVADGNLIIVWLFYESAVQAVQNITDNAANTYQLAVGPTTGQGQLAGWRQELWYAANVNGTPIAPDTTITVTATFPAAFNGEKAIVAHDYIGAQKVSPLDQTATNVGNTTGANQAVSTGARMVRKAELVFAAAVFYGTFGTPGTGFGERSTADNNMSEDLVAVNDMSISATFNTQPMTDWIAQMATFLAEEVAQDATG